MDISQYATMNTYASGGLLAHTRSLLRRAGIRARKGLGQHFLIDEEVLAHIASAAELNSNDVVIEVGPGLGVLTGELVKRAGWVIAVELDDNLAALLGKTLASCDNLSVINRNILDIDPHALLKEQREKMPPVIKNPFRYKVVANLPYYITSPVLRHFLEASRKPEMILVMVQKEVADAIAAGPGQMSVMAVSVQYYGKPHIIRYVSARSFYPAPEVDSALLRIDIYSRPAVAISDESSFFDLVRAGFTAPRKQLVNSLAKGLGLTRAETIILLGKADIAPMRRAEALTLDEWAGLWRLWCKERGTVC